MAVSGGLLLLGAAAHAFEGALGGVGHPLAVRLALLAPSAVLASTRTIPRAVESLRAGKLNIDALMFAAAIGAAALGHWEEGTFLLFLFGLGEAGERLALARADAAVRALSELAPDVAHVRDARSGEVVRRAVKDVAVGESILVRSFERIPLDGTIESGATAIDESTLTGEAVPVDKTVGDSVFAGTTNTVAAIEVKVTQPAGESALAKIVRLVAEARAAQSPTERFTAQVERVYVPLVFVSAAAILAVPPLVGWGAWSVWTYRALAFLTAASPCALALGTPAAVLCGIARAAQLGILVKGGAHLEVLGRVRAMAFDKTGTLTRGRPRVGEMRVADGHDADGVLACAAAIESQVTHPLASAIVEHARAKGVVIPVASEVVQTAGRGASGRVEGVAWGVCKPSAIAEDSWPAVLRAACAELDKAGGTLVVVTRDAAPVGVIELSDELRPEAAATLALLREMSISPLVMLTGDHRASAEHIARSVALDEVHAALRPEEKLEEIGRLRERHGVVVMVGDGVNDAPALAAADVGVAMGAAGATVALETADVALLANSLRRLPTAVALARASNRLIRQNLVIALGVIVIVAPLAALGYARLGLAVLLHEGSTVVVVVNALRLLRFEAGGGEAAGRRG